MMTVNGWDIEELETHLTEQSQLYRHRSKITWEFDLSIITNSGYKLNNDD